MNIIVEIKNYQIQFQFLILWFSTSLQIIVFVNDDFKADLLICCINLFNRNYSCIPWAIYRVQCKLFLVLVYATSGMPILFLFVDFYYALLLYGILFLATGNKVGRTIAMVFAWAYHAFLYFTLHMILI